jgi:Carbohydrate family 9 binding domain-like
MMSRVSLPFRAARALRQPAGHALVVGLAGLIVAGTACVEQAEEKPTAEDMEVIKKNLLTTEPTPQFPVKADIDGKVIYLGLDVSMNPVEPGKDVKLTHYWKVVSPPGAGWRMFVHINGPNNQGFINWDHHPVRGKYPVSQWKAGEIIKDEHTNRLPVTWPHDQMLVYTGLWRGAERMAVKSGAKDRDGRLLAATIPVVGKAAPVASAKRYLIRKASKPIKLDGKLDEPAWKEAASTGLFVDTLTGAPAAHRTEAKLLWDKDNLYIAFENMDTDVWSTLTKRDDKLWTQEAVEIMIDADRNGKSYVEFQVSPNGNMFDTYLPEWRKYENDMDPKRKMFDWNSKAKASVRVLGTLNKRNDEDKGWLAEVAIPLADVNGLAKETVKVPPKLGDSWRLNMFRLDAPEGKPQLTSGWSPPLVTDFHALDKFGEVVFADEKGQVPIAPAAAPGRPTDPHGAMRAAISSGLAGSVAGENPGTDLKKKAAVRKRRAVKDER